MTNFHCTQCKECFVVGGGICEVCRLKNKVAKYEVALDGVIDRLKHAQIIWQDVHATTVDFILPGEALDIARRALEGRE